MDLTDLDFNIELSDITDINITLNDLIEIQTNTF